MRVLCVEHTSVVGGAQRSLLELLRELPAHADVAVACPPGDLAGRVRALGLEVLEVRAAEGSLALHPARTPRALADMAIAARGVRRALRRTAVDAVHANSIRAGLVAGPAATGLAPVVVHVRDVLPPSPATAAVRAAVRGTSAARIAISRHVAAAFDPAAAVVDNPVDAGRFVRPAGERTAVRAALGLPDDVPVVVLVAQVTPWKGQLEAVRALPAVRAAAGDVRLLLVGTTTFATADTRLDNRAYLAEVEDEVRRLALGDAVRLLGQREDVPQLLGACDVLVAPSWEEPFGRSVAEGMAAGLPVVATAVGGPAELLDEGRTGRLVAPRDPAALAAAVGRVLADPDAARAMGEAAREVVRRRCAPAVHAGRVAAVLRGAAAG